MAEKWRDAVQRLGGAQKGHARGAPAYSVYVNRKLGRILAATAFVLGMTPNGVTAVSAVFTFAGIAALVVMPTSVGLGVCVAGCLILGYALDSADGQLARLRGGGTAAGEWLDHFVDAVKIASLHLAVLVGLFRFSDGATGWLVIPLVFDVVAVVTFFGMLLNDLLKGTRGQVSTHARGGGTMRRSLVLLPTDYGLVCLVFVLWGWPTLFLAAYGLLAVGAAGFLAAAAVKWFREMRAIDGAPRPAG